MRRPEDGGRWAGTEDARQTLIRHAVVSGFDWVDIETDIADKIRGGKVQAAGKIVGDVMKATRGQADPARVKELVIAACS